MSWTLGRPLYLEYHLSAFGALIAALPGVSLFGMACTAITPALNPDLPYLPAYARVGEIRALGPCPALHFLHMTSVVCESYPFFYFPLCGRPPQQMDLPEEHDATASDSQPEDARTLVAALTNLLMDDTSPALGTESRADLIDRANLIDLAGTRAESQRPADRHADAVLRGFTSNSSSSNDGLLDEERRTPPEFLGESQVREALQRANSLRPQGQLDDEPHFPSSFLGTHSRVRVEGEWGGAHRDLPPIDPVLVAYPDASNPSRSPAVRLHSQGPVPAQSEIWTRFQPGNETASVLQLTKRPRLRPKDVTHRQSLGHNQQGSSSSVAPTRLEMGCDPPSPTVLPFGYVAHPPLTPIPRNFMVTLTFGDRRVSVPGSPGLLVDDCQRSRYRLPYGT